MNLKDNWSIKIMATKKPNKIVIQMYEVRIENG